MKPKRGKRGVQRRTDWHLINTLSASILALSLLVGCGGASPTGGTSSTGTQSAGAVSNAPSDSADPRRGGTLVIGLAADAIVTLDPAAYSDRTTETVVRNIFDGLVTRTTDNRVVPELAQDYRWVDDRTVDFVLKKAKFHNGEDLTARDVVFTFQRLLNQEIGAPRRSFVEEIASVEAINDSTVRFNLKRPWPVFFQMLVHTQIVPEAYLSEVGDEAFARHPVGSGPFQFVQGTLTQEIILERFDDYYGGSSELVPVGSPFVDRVIFRMVPDIESRMTALREGKVHIIQNVPASLVPQLTADPNLTVKTTVGTRPKFVDINTTVAPLDDVRVRRALNYAVDADAILAQVAGGYGVILPGPLSPANYYADPTLTPYGYDPEQARALLAQAGYRPEEIHLTIDAYGSYTEIAEAVAGQLAALGMEVTVETWDYGVLRPLLLDCQRQAFVRDWGDSAFDPVGYIEAKWHTYVEGTPEGRGNFACYSNARVDELIQAGASEPDPDKRRAIYFEAQRLILDDAPAIFLYVPQEIEATSAQVRNWEPSPDSRINLHDVWLVQD